ncbi:MAG: hypothetical protein ACP5K1_02005 [Candidatus Bathyarchaeia archaeon]
MKRPDRPKASTSETWKTLEGISLYSNGNSLKRLPFRNWKPLMDTYRDGGSSLGSLCKRLRKGFNHSLG